MVNDDERRGCLTGEVGVRIKMLWRGVFFEKWGDCWRCFGLFRGGVSILSCWRDLLGSLVEMVGSVMGVRGQWRFYGC